METKNDVSKTLKMKRKKLKVMTRKIWKIKYLKMKNIILKLIINMKIRRNVWGVMVLKEFIVKEYKWKERRKRKSLKQSTDTIGNAKE